MKKSETNFGNIEGISKSLFVAISDIHFNINNLDIASKALILAIQKAKELQVPLVIAGDLNDTKAIIRAEVANRLIDIFEQASHKIFVLVGNHDLINEKNKEHSLNFLRPYVIVIQEPWFSIQDKVSFIPYQSDSEQLKVILNEQAKGSLLVMHQGFMGAFMGEYIQDKSSINPDLVKDFTVISGHYHRHQTLGTVTYIGTPYTTSFAEANDGPKGILVVNEDQSFYQIPLNLRKHHIIEIEYDDLKSLSPVNTETFVRLKVKGFREQLDSSDFDKETIKLSLGNPSKFILEKIYQKVEKMEVLDQKLPASDIFDQLIDKQSSSEVECSYLKRLWKTIYENIS